LNDKFSEANMQQQQQQQAGQKWQHQQLLVKPGAEFLERRWRRAAQVPASESSPDVAAFVAAYQLLQKAHALLPVDDKGRPTLADTPVTQPQVLSAVLQLACAEFLSPLDSNTLLASNFPEVAYCGRLKAWAKPPTGAARRARTSGDVTLLAEALACWLAAGHAVGGFEN
jgi:hypothetical protein